MFPQARTLTIVLVVLLSVLAGALGFRWASVRGDARLTQMGTAMQEAHARELEEMTEALSADSVDARIQRDASEVALQRLQARLDEVQAENMAARQELDLYQRIASTNVRTGLGVDSYEWNGGDDPWLAITLVQARGRDRVRGSVGITLLRDRDGVTESMVISQPGDDSGIGFDLRFFETLRVPMAGVEEFQPESLEIVVQPAGTRHKSFEEVVLWADIPNT